MKKIDEPILPAARADSLIVQELAEEVLVYDEERHRAHCLNQTAALVWQRLDGQSTASQIAARLSREQDEAVSAELVELAVEELRRNGLLQWPIEMRGKSALSRRAMMRRVGLGAAMALPVVASVIAPRAVQAATCKGNGQPCGTSAECCSGLCSAGTCA